MKTVLLVFIVLIFSSVLKADAIDPSSYVIEAIRAAQNNNIDQFRRIVDIQKISTRNRANSSKLCLQNYMGAPMMHSDKLGLPLNVAKLHRNVER